MNNQHHERQHIFFFCFLTLLHIFWWKKLLNRFILDLYKQSWWVLKSIVKMQLLHSQRVVASCCLPLRIFRRTSGTGGFHAPLGAGSAVVSPCRTLLRWGPAMMSCLRVIKSRLGLIFAAKMPERHFEHVGCEKSIDGKDLFSHFYV